MMAQGKQIGDKQLNMIQEQTLPRVYQRHIIFKQHNRQDQAVTHAR